MLKNLALTISLVGAGWAIGWHGDKILSVVGPLAEQVVQEVTAVQNFFSYDPRTATLNCIRPGVDQSQFAGCKAHYEAWVAIDGREAVRREIMNRVFEVAREQVQDPVALIMLDAWKGK